MFSQTLSKTRTPRSLKLQVKQGIDVISNLIGDPGKERIAKH